MAVLVSASPTFVFYQNQILSKYHLNTIFVAFYSATHLKMSLIELFASNTEGQCQQMVSSQSQSVIIFFLVLIHTHNLIFQKYSVCCVQDLLSGFICITLILGRAADPQSVVDVLLRLLFPKGFLPQPKF